MSNANPSERIPSAAATKLYVADPHSPGVEENTGGGHISSSTFRRSALSPVQGSATLSGSSNSPAGGQTMNIRSLIAQKEKELHEINDYRVSTLEEELRRREKAEVTVRAKFGKLKEDFMYNLKLIEDRDAELDRYEANFDSLKGVIRSKDNDLNELRTELADTGVPGRVVYGVRAYRVVLRRRGCIDCHTWKVVYGVLRKRGRITGCGVPR